MTLTNDQIQKGIADLPDNIRNAVLGFDWAGEILTIGQEYQLHMDEIGLFRQQTLAVILGKSPAAQYESHLINEVGIPKNIAGKLVTAANDRIFTELQRRAFPPKKYPSDSGTIGTEVIEHHEVKNILADEGIHLIDDNEPAMIDTELHKEVTYMMNEGETDSSSVQQKTNLGAATNTTSNKPKVYQEPINQKDLKGIHRHRTNTNIIQHSEPEHILKTDKDFALGRNLGQGSYAPNQSLDKKILQQTVISNDHEVTLNSDTLKTDNNFLDQISK